MKTKVGCWKLVYAKGMEQIALYYRNSKQPELNFKHPEKDRYHQQRDRRYFNNIAQPLNYIYDHDKYSATVQRGIKESCLRARNTKNRQRNVKDKLHLDVWIGCWT